MLAGRPLLALVFLVTSGCAAINVDPVVSARAAVVYLKAGTASASATYVGSRALLTAAHAVTPQTEMSIQFGGRSWKAALVSADYVTDIALIRTDEDVPGLRPLEWASDLSAGARVFAVGFPGPLDASQATATSGIVSAFREIDGVRYLQLDAALNPGNSGGAVVTEQGRLAGVVVARVRESVGLGFAVPADVAREYVSRPLSRGVPPTATPDSAPIIEFVRTYVALRTEDRIGRATPLPSPTGFDAVVPPLVRQWIAIASVSGRTAVKMRQTLPRSSQTRDFVDRAVLAMEQQNQSYLKRAEGFSWLAQDSTKSRLAFDAADALEKQFVRGWLDLDDDLEDLLLSLGVTWDEVGGRPK